MQQDCRHTVKNVNPTQIAAELFGCLDILHKHTHTHTHTHTQLALLAYNTLNTRIRAR